MEQRAEIAKLDVKLFIKGLLAVSIISFALHFLVLRFIDVHVGLNKIIEIYVFLLIISLVHFWCIKWLFSRWPRYSGLLFTAVSMFKMFVALLYLLPDIYPSNDSSLPIVLNFMVVYFVVLFFEVIFILKALMKLINDKSNI